MLEKITKEELKKVRNNLPKDAIERIAQATGYQPSSVKKILQDPGRFDKDVLKKAIALIKEEGEEIILLKNDINDLPTAS